MMEFKHKLSNILKTSMIGLIIPALLAAPFSAGAEIKELKIGVINELTGPLASLGTVCSRGMDVAMHSFAPEGRIGGSAVRLIVGDARDDAKTSVSEFQRMTDVEGAQVILAIRSKTAMPVNPLSARRAIPMVGIVGHPQFLAENPYALRVYGTAAREGGRDAELAHALNLKRAAFIAAEDEWSLGLTTATAAAVKKNGGEVVLQDTQPPQDNDFAAIISRLKQAKPDVVFVNLLTRSGLFLRKLREAGVRTQAFTTYWILQPEQIAAAGRDALEGLIFLEVNSEKPLFRRAYADAFPHEDYNGAAYLCYAALGTILKAAGAPGGRGRAEKSNQRPAKGGSAGRRAAL